MPSSTPIDRRALISGRFPEADPVVPPPGAEIASVLVQVRPERLADAEAAIVALGGCEIHARDPRGKLVVVIEAASGSAIGTILNTIGLLPHVLSATLVFHATDSA